MKTRIATSELKRNVLHRIYIKSLCKTIVEKLKYQHGDIIPFRVLPKLESQRQEVFVLLIEQNYIPKHELKLFLKQ